MKLLTRFSNFWFLLRRSRFDDILKKIVFRIHSDTSSYCLRRDLAIPFEPPPAQIDLVIRPFVDADLPQLTKIGKSGLTKEDETEIVSRLEHLHAKIPTCYVALSGEGTLAYMQWLMGSGQNERIRAYFNGTFPVLGADEAILENAFTLPGFRGKGVMPAAMARIAERGADIGARFVMTFVEEHNIPSLKGCKRSGFSPYMMRRERWFMFHRTLTFTRLPENSPYPFDLERPAPPA